NLVIGLLGKREFGIRRVIGRVNNPRNAWLYSAAFGFDAAVRPAETIVPADHRAVAVEATVGVAGLCADRAVGAGSRSPAGDRRR
ncbi:MAG TPA: TrkA family potassium uptake protein, partial [Chloroflexota bacterium]|nr:TrkA family potassium uptake protein [Chloroflexota bacterium]